MKKLLYIIITGCWLLLSWGLHGQDIQEMVKSKPFSIKGAVYGNGEYINSDRYSIKNNLFLYSVGASLNCRIYGVSVPFSLVYSNRKARFNQPFQRIGLSPKYKWITVHGGYRNVYFSDFTLAGRTVLGYGLVLTPGKWKIGWMQGKVQNVTTLSSVENLEEKKPLFNRDIVAATIGYQGNESSFSLNMLRGSDRYNKTSADSSQPYRVYPEANFVISVNVKQKIANFMHIEAEGAGSAYTRNLNSTNEIVTLPAENLISKIIKVNASSQLNYALKAGIYFDFSNLSFSLNYKKILPDFKSMGAYFFETDIEEYAAYSTINLWKGRISLSGNIGVQKNNLTERRLQTSNRILAGGNARVKLFPNVQLMVNYTNNKIDLVNVITDQLYLDSFNLQHNNNQYIVNINWLKSADIGNHVVNGGFNYNTYAVLSSYDPAIEQSLGNKSINYFLSYNFRWKAQKLTAGIQLVYNKNSSERTTSSRQGSTVSLGKQLLKDKASIRLSMSLNGNKTNRENDGLSIRNSLTASYSPGKHHSFGFNFDRVSRTYKTTERTKFTDFRSGLRYTYSF